jgi:anaerobic magnesium-protoporphyrin IX monomethyl ester cyclase
MNKGFSVDQVRVAAGWIHDAGIELACYVMVGYLGESFHDVGKTLALLDEIRPECLSVSVAYPLPGTTYYDLVKDRIFDATSWRHTNDYRVGYHRRYPDAYYRSARDLILRHWERRAQLSGATVPRRILSFLREAQARANTSALAFGRWA